MCVHSFRAKKKDTSAATELLELKFYLKNTC